MQILHGSIHYNLDKSRFHAFLYTFNRLVMEVVLQLEFEGHCEHKLPRSQEHQQEDLQTWEC